MSKIKHEFPSINHELFIKIHLYTFSNMKRLFLSLLTGIAALCCSAQTKDSVDVSQFTVVYGLSLQEGARRASIVDTDIPPPEGNGAFPLRDAIINN